jgi:hypothetical protein
LPTSGVTITSATVIPAVPQSVSGGTVTLATNGELGRCPLILPRRTSIQVNILISGTKRLRIWGERK